MSVIHYYISNNATVAARARARLASTARRALQFYLFSRSRIVKTSQMVLRVKPSPRLDSRLLFFHDTFREEGVAAWNFSRESCL